MRVSFALLLVALAPVTECFGFRGAAERAMIFNAYVLEEVWEDGPNANNRKIATGCPGSRTGIRGQANRCTLPELLDYLWSQSNLQLLNANGSPIRRNGQNVFANDARPPLAHAQAFFNANPRASNLAQNDPVSIAQGIMSYTQGGQTGTSPKNGYTNNYNSRNVLAGQSYTGMIRNFGANVQPSKNEVTNLLAIPAGQPGALTQAQRTQLNKFKVQVDLAAVLVSELRKQDIDRVAVNGARNGNPPPFADFINQQPPLIRSDLKFSPYSPPPKRDQNGQIFNFNLRTWMEPDFARTIQAAVNRNVPRQQAQAAYQAAEAAYNQNRGVSGHNAALGAINQSRAALGC